MESQRRSTRKGAKSETKNGVDGHTNGVRNGHKNGTAKGKKPIPGSDMSFFTYHFNYTLSPLFLMLTCPNAVILLWYTAVHCKGSYQILAGEFMKKGFFTALMDVWTEAQAFSPLAAYVLLGYALFAAVLHVTLPGPKVDGPLTPNDNTPVYKDNGFACYIVTMVTFGVVTVILKQNGMSPTIVYDHFSEFLGTITIFSLIFCVGLYFKGLNAPSSSDCGSSGNAIFDYYWGTELYPRIGSLDVKVFTNCRFGMTVWPLLVLINSIKSYELYGFVDSAWVSCFLHFVYFTKFFWWEAGYMWTIDIMVDRAGFYICWGCLAFIPGLYALTSLYLVNHPVQLGVPLSLVILILGSASTFINYWADQQKQVVRQTNGKCTIWGRKPEVIRARYTLENGQERESLLLVSGWWGVARHFHYVPELALAFLWSVPGLFENVQCYTYFLFLFVLLTHRTFRDDDKCRKKYGKYWEEYCKRVPYKMIPYVF